MYDNNNSPRSDEEDDATTEVFSNDSVQVRAAGRLCSAAPTSDAVGRLRGLSAAIVSSNRPKACHLCWMLMQVLVRIRPSTSLEQRDGE